MKRLFILMAVLLSACDQADDHGSTNQETSDSAALEPSTNLAYDTVYYYQSVFPEFHERLKWIVNTDPNQLRTEASKARESSLRTKDTVQNILSIALRGFVPPARPRDDEGEPSWPWWCDPTGNLSDSPIENTFERTIRSLPKLESDGIWKLQEIESYSGALNDPAKEIFEAMSEYNGRGRGRTIEAQPQARVVATACALVFRQSDSSLLFINGIKWNHPLYSDGYTEFHLHISLKTGAVINDTYAYTTFPLEPGSFSQYTTMTMKAIEAVKLARSLMGG